MCDHGLGMQGGWNPPRWTFFSICDLSTALSLQQTHLPSVMREELSAPAAGHAAVRYGCSMVNIVSCYKSARLSFSAVIFYQRIEGLDRHMGHICDCVCLFASLPTLQNNVAGALCDECKPGFFHLSGSNAEGCLQCFCMGVTKQCSSSTWNREQVGCQALNGKRRSTYIWHHDVTQCLLTNAVSANLFRF